MPEPREGTPPTHVIARTARSPWSGAVKSSRQSRNSLLVCAWNHATPNPAGAARELLGRELGVLAFSEVPIDDLVLAVSELVANATEHAIGPYELWLRRTPSAVVCEVYDHDPHVPQRPMLPAEVLFRLDPQRRGGGLDALCALLSERGRGLQFVDHLTNGRWGFRLTEDGRKIAWVAVRVGRCGE